MIPPLPKSLSAFFASERGDAAMEYALIAGVLGIAGVLALVGIQDAIGVLFENAAATCDPVVR